MPIVMSDEIEKEVKVTDDPFKELERIMDIESDGKQVGWRLRREALKDWMDRWICEVSSEISVMSPEMYTSDHKDFIMDKLTEQLAQELTEETKFKQSGRRMKATMRLIKRKPKK